MKRNIYVYIIIVFLAISFQVKPQSLNSEVKFCVISDPHLYDSTLGISGAAFEYALLQDTKMLAESESILKSAIDIIKAEDPEFIIIPGDLTMNGERHNHELLASYLAQLKAEGIASYVVPGNHDVANPHSYRYEGDSAYSIPSVTAEEFAEIYSDFGFSQAIARDTASLSYIAEPAEGIYLFALDACRYKENTTGAITGGRFSSFTLDWIKENLIKAKSENKLAIGMMHHGILEHYIGQKTLFSAFVVDGYDTVSAMFAEYGMKVMFTGHYHAQDIVYKEFNDSSKLYDVETGSLISNTNPIRTVTVTQDMSMKIETNNVTDIDYPMGGLNFTEYASLFVKNNLNVLVPYILTSQEFGLGVSEAEAAFITPVVIEALTAHYAGDEIPSPSTLQLINTLLANYNPDFVLLGTALNNIWTDPEPADNNYTINNISAVTADDNSSAPVKNFTLSQNYPNPFNPGTSMQFTVGRRQLITLKVYDVLGREVAVLVNEEKAPGTYSVKFDASQLSSGVYYYTLKQGSSVLTRSMVLIK